MGRSNRKLLSWLTVGALGLSLLGPTITQAQETDRVPFTDDQNHWAGQQINEWVSKGFIKGYEDRSFRPNQQITRAEFMTVVNQSFGYSATASIDFVDVPADAWYRTEVQKATAAGYIKGYEDQTVRPTAPISRQEVASILANILNLDTASNRDAALQSFTDRTAIPNWSKNSIGAIVAEGLMKGYPDGAFRPGQSITRAEAIVTLDNALDKDVATPVETFDQAGTYGSSEQAQTFAGDVIITAADVTLLNKVITGDLIIDEGVADGDVILDRVTVKGTTIIRGGGEDSIVVKNSTLNKVIVIKQDGKARVVTENNSSINEIVLQSGATLEGDGFQQILLSNEIPADSVIYLIGEFDQIDVEAKDVEIRIPEGTVISTLNLDAAVKVTGKGTIEVANINVSSSKLEMEPKKYNLAKNITATIAGKTVGSKQSGGGGGGGGGGGTSDQSPPEITEISFGDFDGDHIKIDLKSLPDRYPGLTITVSSDSDLRLRFGDDDDITFGPIGLSKGENGVGDFDLSSTDLTGLDDETVDFARIIDAIKKSDANRSVIANAINLDDIFAELDDAVDIIKFASVIKPEKLGVDPEDLIEDILDLDNRNLSAIHGVLKENGVGKLTLMSAVEYDELFTLIDDSDIDRTVLLEAIELDKIFAEIMKSSGLGTTLFEIIAALDNESSSKRLIVEAELEAGGEKSNYTFIITK